jgi:hypothetical protein
VRCGGEGEEGERERVEWEVGVLGEVMFLGVGRPEGGGISSASRF